MKRGHGALLLFLVATAPLVPRDARAHAEPYSWVDVRCESGRWSGQVTAHVVDLAHELGVATPESLLVDGFVAARAGDIEEHLTRLLWIEADGAPLVPRWTGWKVFLERRAVALAFELPAALRPRQLRLVGPLFAYDAAHETFFNAYEDGAVRHQDLLDAGHRASIWNTGFHQGRLDVVRRFLAEGVHHIFIGPDHILFVVGLLLLGGGVRQLLKIVTAFTLAHSVTLALAATGLVTPPARLVEPAIALSIVWVGGANLLAGGSRRRDRRALVAATFGLVHGFGFATVLGDLGLPRQALAWSLFSFNAGVEVGQACIVLAVAPVLALLRAHRPRLATRTVLAGSALVVAAGTFWFVQRAFLS